MGRPGGEGGSSFLRGGGKEEGRPGPVRSDTPPHPLDTPPSDPGPEERVQSQQTAETHGLRAGGGAAPRRAWYGGRAGSRAPDSGGERAEGGRGCRGGGVGEMRELSGGGRRRRRHSLLSCEWEPGRRRRPPLGSGAGLGLWVRGPSGLCSVSLLSPLQQRSLPVFLVLVKIVSLDL